MTGREDTPPPEEPEFDADAFEAAFAQEFGDAVEPDRTIGPADPGGDGHGQDRPGVAAGAQSQPSAEDSQPSAEGPGGSAPRRVVAVVLTPIASAPALAGLCAMAKIDADIVPTRRGAVAVRVIETTGDDPSELLGGPPAEADELAATLSRTSKAGVVLLTARLGTGDEGLTGTITGRQYDAGEAGEEVAAGLMLAHADDVVEQMLLGLLPPAQAPGRLAPKELSRWQAARLLSKATKRKRP
ncbi:hypothetical protein IM660_08025 [Ruania alkalisoli]|uniref:Uncharacterized protein n=1 Tax=Ruania alkalisoli TaxID=2779775 RepID=A0A7M1SX82_9MICO|nr:hypothetical protein [Ruania alkalisoli]QOR72169.1 hypothetical protein IM660_08025 [Ruania alkalisoli]